MIRDRQEGRVPSPPVRRRPLLPHPARRALVRSAVPIVAVLVGLGLLGSCAGERPSLGQAVVGTTAVPGTETTTSTTVVGGEVGALVPSAETLLGYIATPTGDPDVRATPAADGDPVEVAATTTAGAPTTFAIVGDPTADDGDGWYQVQLPSRPNGATGWVSAAAVTLSKTPFRVLVDLDARTLRVEDDGAEVLSTPIAVGTSENPTPTGATYVTELIENVEPEGSYGPYAFGLALHSDTLTEFAGGPGQVGIHGTDSPDLIGQAVSSGCVRLTNEAIGQLVDLQLPLGVPVLIS